MQRVYHATIAVLLFGLFFNACSLPTTPVSDDDLTALLTLFQVQENSSQISRWAKFDMQINATVTAPTKATTPIIDQAAWRRVGDSMEIMYNYRHTNNTGATAGSGTYLYTIPNFQLIDSSKVAFDSIAQNNKALGIVGTGHTGNDVGSDGTVAVIVAYNDTGLAMILEQNNGSGDTVHQSGVNAQLNAAEVNTSFRATVPILGW